MRCAPADATTYAVSGFIGRDKVIHHRFWWMSYDLLQFFTSCVTGLTSALVRLSIAIGLMLVGFARIDKSLTPRWVDDIMLLDSLAKSYRSAILVYHHHNNPLVHVFIALLATDAKARRASSSCGFASPAKRRVANRWRKTVFMLNNPVAASYKAACEPDDPEEEGPGDESARGRGPSKVVPV